MTVSTRSDALFKIRKTLSEHLVFRIQSFIAIFALTFFPVSESIFAGTVSEYALKAVFSLNFTRFIRWPESAFEDETSSCILCVAGAGQAKPDFRAVDGEKAGSRILRVRFIETPEEIGLCHMVFISRTVTDSDVSRILEAIKAKPVVTVGETERFIQQGGMINLFFKNGRLNFEINTDIARQQNVTLSSRLLKLAVLVKIK